MIALWMIYALVVSGLLTLAGWAAEHALRLHGRPARWVWAVALLAALLIPLVVHSWPAAASEPAGETATAPASSPTATAVVAALSLLESSPPLLTLATPYLLASWALLTLAALAFFAAGHLHLRRSRRRWVPARVLGEPVRVSESFGPAVVGAFRPAIVLPRWALELDQEGLDLVMRHEAEHVKSRDTLLIAVASMLTALVPWSPFAWWQFGRLRLAVELDCDARVLARIPAHRRYADLLLRLSQSSARAPFTAATLSEPKAFLKRRVEMIGTRSFRGRGLRTVGALVLMAGTIAVACEVPAPTSPPSLESRGALLGRTSEAKPDWIEDVLRRMESVKADLESLTSNIESDRLPLVLVDDKRMTSEQLIGLVRLQWDQIASVEVKGAEIAERKYGPDASEGVVLVHTKSGRGFELPSLWEGQVSMSHTCAAGVCGPIAMFRTTRLLREMLPIPRGVVLHFEMGEGGASQAGAAPAAGAGGRGRRAGAGG